MKNRKINEEVMIGFGTGSFYKNLQPVSKEATDLVKGTGCNAIEFCALNPERLDFFKDINVDNFRHVSLHAPDIEYRNDSFSLGVLNKIEKLHKRFNFKTVVVCPNYVVDFSVFEGFDFPLSFENMDKRKNFGTSVEDMRKIFNLLPNAKFVLDLTHVFTNDNSMKLAKEFVKEFKDRLVEIHLSGYRIHSDGDEQQHYPICVSKQKEILDSVPFGIPIIIESVFPKTERIEEKLFDEVNFIRSYLNLLEES